MALMLCCGSLLVAQTNVDVRKATLSVPFGEVKGKILVVENFLIFVDEEKLDDSFAIDRRMVANVERMDRQVIIETKEPIRDRSGERTRLAFRLNDKETAAIMTWFERGPTVNDFANTATGGRSAAENRRAVLIYDAKHKHSLYGSCQGKLVVKENMISYESLNDRGHSRQYPFSDIKKLKRNGPYQMEVQTFNRGSYNFELQGNGMDIADFKTLEESIATARASR